MKVYELIQELASYDAGDTVDVSIPGGHTFDIEGLRRGGYGSTVVIDVRCEEDDLAALYSGVQS